MRNIVMFSGGLHVERLYLTRYLYLHHHLQMFMQSWILQASLEKTRHLSLPRDTLQFLHRETFPGQRRCTISPVSSGASWQRDTPKRPLKSSSTLSSLHMMKLHTLSQQISCYLICRISLLWNGILTKNTFITVK